MTFSRTLLFVLCLGFAQSVYAQANNKQLSHDIDASFLRKHLSVIASDAYEGRETGKRGSLLAADYISSYFKQLGLEGPVNGSYFQQVPLVERGLTEATITVNKQVFNYGEDFLMVGEDAGNSFNLSSTEFVFAGFGISSSKWNDLSKVSIKDKVVLVLNGEPMSVDGKSLVTGKDGYSDYVLEYQKKIDELRAQQPRLILLIFPNLRSSLGKYADPLKSKTIDYPQKTSNSNKVIPAPVVYVSGELADALLKTNGKTAEGLATQIQTTRQPQSKVISQPLTLKYNYTETPVKAMNILGYLPGTDLKDEVLVVSAHYDHIGIVNGKINNGADDDGSGTTSVLALASAFSEAKKEGKGPRRSILFITFTGEEKGLLGSQWYSEHPVFPFEKTIADLNIDMVGRIDEYHMLDTNYVYLIGSDKLSTDLHKISEETNSQTLNLKLDYKYNDPKDPNRFYYRSDHYNFARHGVPVIFYFNGVHNDYHQPGDDVEKIHFDLMAKRVQLIYNTVWQLSNRDKRPAVDMKNTFPSNR